MNKEEIIDEAYENYEKLMYDSEWRYNNRLNLNWFTRDHESETHMMSGPAYRPLTKEEFIDKCKTDTEFSKRWGLKIEERELSDNERQGILERVSPMYYMDQQFGGEDIFTRNNIPTKLITIKYKNETIESYV